MIADKSIRWHEKWGKVCLLYEMNSWSIDIQCLIVLDFLAKSVVLSGKEILESSQCTKYATHGLLTRDKNKTSRNKSHSQ